MLLIRNAWFEGLRNGITGLPGMIEWIPGNLRGFPVANYLLIPLQSDELDMILKLQTG